MEEKRYELETMPFDKVFETGNGTEMCHATGYAIYDGSAYWNEYEDSEGNLYYGR